MSTPGADTRQMFEQYIDALNGKPKTSDIVNRYVSDPALQEHIRVAEAGFPAYHLEPEQVVVEGEDIALRGTFRGVHKGPFAGVEATGIEVSAPVMIFYKVADGRLAQHWMQFDVASVMQQLTSTGGGEVSGG